MCSDPNRRPVLRKGDDLRLFARRALDYGDANATKLSQCRGTYEAIRQEYARP